MMLPLLLAGFVIVGLMWYLQRRRRPMRWVTDGELLRPQNQQGIYISTAKEQAERAARLLPTEPTEFVSHLLGDLGLPPRRPPDATREYLPEPLVDWVITANFTGSPVITVDRLKAVFVSEWRGKFGHPQLYGRDSTTGRWTFAYAADVTGPFSALKLAWRLYDPSEGAAPADRETFEIYREVVAQQMTEIAPTEVRTSLPPTEAAARAAALERIHTAFNRMARITLTAEGDALFDGREIWDVMLSLGLRWGDMDRFHWENASDAGDDHHFSVWTTTPPGYFVPEQIARNEAQVEDLVFGFQIPRAARPVAIGEAMLRCATYAQKRLGGKLVDADGNPFSPEAFRQAISETDRGLRDVGFPPGSPATLQLF